MRRRVLPSEVLAVWMGQISKPFYNLILPVVSADNKPVNQTIGGTNNQKLSLNGLSIVLERDKVCSK